MKRLPLTIAAVLAVLVLPVASGAGQEAAQNKYVNSIGMTFMLLPAGEVRIAEFAPPAAKWPIQGTAGGNRAAAPQNAPVDGASQSVAADAAGAGRGGRRGGAGPRGDNPVFAGKPYLQGGAAPTADELTTETQGAAAAYQPGFMVKFSKPFYMGTYEVTQAQFKRVMGFNPSLFKDKPDSDNRPVESVTWQQAQEFVRRLNALEKTKAYRLPTEFEWEYAARAGGPANTFDPPFFDQANGGYNRNWETKPVGSLKPNPWGLYDMAGNVWEWVNDIYNNKLLADPKAPAKGKLHVIKGGSFLSTGMNSIPFTHAGGPASVFDVGFRIVRDQDGTH